MSGSGRSNRLSGCIKMNGSTSCVTKNFTLQEELEFVKKRPACGRALDPQNGGSATWVRRGFTDVEKLYPSCRTAYEIFKYAVSKYEEESCMGTRELLEYVERGQPDGKKLVQLRQGNYKFLTYGQVDAEIDLICKGFMSLGVKSYDKVAFYAETRAEWFIAAQGCWRNSVCVSTVYTTLGDEAITYAINQIECSVIVTSHDYLEKLRKIIEKLPHIKTIVYMKSINPTAAKPKPFDKLNLYTYDEVRNLGMTAELDVKISLPKADDAAVLMYTSGSTGVPKGVIILHSNIVAVVKGYADVMLDVGGSNDVYIAYLPLAHIMEMSVEMSVLCKGVRIGYSSPLTLTDAGTAVMPGSTGDATVLRPTVMVAVPLVLDRVRKAITSKVEAKSTLARAVFAAAFHYKSWWISQGQDTPVMDHLLFAKMKAAIGGRMRVLISGGAPLSEDTQVFIRNCICTSMCCGYGLTETTAGASLADFRDRKTNCVGPPLVGVQMRLEDWEEGGYTTKDKPHPRGEILVGGDTIAGGYYKNEEETKKCFFFENGIRWFRTGDIGEILSDGSFRIIDRKKDLIKLQAGEYVAPGKIEAILKTSSLVDNVCVHGNGLCNFVVALICPVEAKLKALAEELGKPYTSFEAICKDAEITQNILLDLQELCRKSGLVRLEIPKYIYLCSQLWTPESELVTAALKVRRRNIYTFYSKDLDALYKSERS